MKFIFPLLAILTASSTAYANAIDLSDMSDEMVVNLAHAEMLGICKGGFEAGTGEVTIKMNGAYYYKDGSPILSIHDGASILRILVKSGVCQI